MDPMPTKEYIKRGGVRCPVCHEDAVDAADQMQIDGESGLQPMMCRSCKAHWTETWQLVGYELDEPVFDEPDEEA